MSKFEVRGESQSLRHGNVTPSLEHHHSKWPSRKRVTDDKLSDHVETNLLVSDGLYHSHGNHVDESYYESQDKSPNWHFRGPDFNRNGTKYKHSHKNADEPPFSPESIQSICGLIILAAHCNSTYDPTGYYTSFADCTNYLTNVYQWGTWDDIYFAGNTTTCRFYYGLLAIGRPQVHCPHVGKTGGWVCIDHDYNSYYNQEY